MYFFIMCFFYIALVGLSADLKANRALWSFFLKIIQWICEHGSACHSFDLIQEFLIGKCC